MNEKVVINRDSLTSLEGNKINNLYRGGGSSSIFSDIKELANELKGQTWTEIFTRCRASRKLVLLVVFIALFFDNMLLTTVGKS